MQFSNTTTKDGLLQDIEHLTNLGDGAITGSTATTTRLIFTSLINRRLERAMGMVGGNSRTSLADDTNYTNQPFSTFDIVSGQNDYQFLLDADGNAITDIAGVSILTGTGETQFITLEKLTEVKNDILSPNSLNTGVPTSYLEQNNTIFFDKIPNYSKVGGGKLFYKRTPSYFVASDTTKIPGFQADHHRILSLGASFDWIIVNKPDQVTLITRIESELKRAEQEFKDWIRMRNPNKNRFTVRQDSCR